MLPLNAIELKILSALSLMVIEKLDVCGYSPIGRGACLRSKMLGVRIPLSAHGGVAQLAEAADPKSATCWFESSHPQITEGPAP